MTATTTCLECGALGQSGREPECECPRPTRLPIRLTVEEIAVVYSAVTVLAGLMSEPRRGRLRHVHTVLQQQLAQFLEAQP